MWAVGPTWMLVITILEVISLVFTDSLPLPKHMPYEHPSGKEAADVEQGNHTQSSEITLCQILSYTAGQACCPCFAGWQVVLLQGEADLFQPVVLDFAGLASFAGSV